MRTRLSYCYTTILFTIFDTNSTGFFEGLFQLIWLFQCLVIYFSCYNRKMGPKLRADKNAEYLLKYLSYSKGQEKEFYHNVYTKASRRLDHFMSAIKLVLLRLYIYYLQLQWSNGGVAEALQKLYTSGIEQHIWIWIYKSVNH